jgi:molybdenum cofactor cytidylyltransferase
MPEPATVSAIVLAAGTASRMGSHKQLLLLGAKTLLEHTLDNLRASRVQEIIVVLGAAAQAIRPLIAPDVKVVVNEAFAAGMCTSLQCGLSALNPQAAATLVVLADQPLVKAATINQLIDDYRRHKPQILIPLYRGFRGNPVLLDRSVFPEIAELHGDMGCRAIFGDHLENIRKTEVADPGVLLDADRPQDFETLSEIYASGTFALPLLERAETSLPASPDVVVVGRESVATAITKFARLLEYRVTVIDPLLTFEEMPAAASILRSMDFSRLPESARQFCVVASMGRFDEEAIEQALAVGFPYIALVANKKRSQEVLQSLGFRGIAADRLAGVRTKPGLSIGAQTPPEIALSIVAEIVAERRA